MGRDELRESELEQELEALYKKVASLDSLGDIKRIEQGSKEPAKPEEGFGHEHQPHESLFQAKEKRTLRLFRIVPALGFITLSCILVAILVWPKIYRYESVNSGGITYSVRINSLTGKSKYFDGREWSQFPIPANFEKKVSEIPNDQPTKVQPTRVDTIKNQREGLHLQSLPHNTKNWNYAIQVKAYPEAGSREAIAFAEYVKKGQHDVHMEKVHLPGRGIWYRILIGYFMTAEAASDYMKKKSIIDAYPDSYVQSRSE